jgi:hypothetical protein
MGYIANIEDTISSLQGHGVEIDPNVVSGSDLDGRNFQTKSFHGYNEQEGSEAVENTGSEAEALLKRIEEAQKVVAAAKIEKAAQEDVRDIALSTMKPITSELYKAYDTRNKGTVTDPTEKAALDVRIAYLQQAKAQYRADWSNANGAISKASTLISANESMVFGLKKQYETLTGSKVDADPIEVLDGVEVPKEGIIKQIGDKLGLTKNQTYMGIGAIAILGVALIVKK